MTADYGRVLAYWDALERQRAEGPPVSSHDPAILSRLMWLDEEAEASLRAWFRALED